MYRLVIALLEGAVGQLHRQQHPAQGALLEAASLLRQQIHSSAAVEVPDGRGRLLAWQARKVREYIDSHITAGAILVTDLCALVHAAKHTSSDPSGAHSGCHCAPLWCAVEWNWPLSTCLRPTEP
jgi:hypothetical protein